MPDISVIIPCYNQGQYIDEAVDSVLAQTFQNFEIIIINDGSTDPYTIDKLQNYEKPKTRVIHTTNSGLAAARNNGIRESTGEIVLPLDADDYIGSEYLELAYKVFEKDANVGIVYCKAEKFGEQKGEWKLPKFSISNFLLYNGIFCSAMFRRSDYDKVKGYDLSMKYGREDWELWISIIELNRTVFQIQKTLFFYRIWNISMRRSITKEQSVEMNNYIFSKHLNLYLKIFGDPIDQLKENSRLVKLKSNFIFRILNYFKIAFRSK